MIYTFLSNHTVITSDTVKRSNINPATSYIISRSVNKIVRGTAAKGATGPNNNLGWGPIIAHNL